MTTPNPTTIALLQEIDRFLRAHNMTEWQFGMTVMSDNKIIPRMREGHNIQAKTRARIESFMHARRQVVLREAVMAARSAKPAAPGRRKDDGGMPLLFDTD